MSAKVSEENFNRFKIFRICVGLVFYIRYLIFHEIFSTFTSKFQHQLYITFTCFFVSVHQWILNWETLLIFPRFTVHSIYFKSTDFPKENYGKICKFSRRIRNCAISFRDVADELDESD